MVREMIAVWWSGSRTECRRHRHEEDGQEVTVGEVVRVGEVPTVPSAPVRLSTGAAQLSQMFIRGIPVTKMPMKIPMAENSRIPPKMG